MKNKKESKIRTRIILDSQKDDGNWDNIGIDFSDEYVAILQKTITELKDTMRRLKND